MRPLGEADAQVFWTLEPDIAIDDAGNMLIPDPVEELYLETATTVAHVIAAGGPHARPRTVQFELFGPSGKPAGPTYVGLPPGYLGGGTLNPRGMITMRPDPLDEGDGVYRVVVRDRDTFEIVGEASAYVRFVR